MSILNNNSIFSPNECLRLAPKPGESVWVLDNVGKGENNSRQNDKPQNNSTTRHNCVESPARSPGETSWAQNTTETEENSCSFRQSYLNQNINSSRQNDDVLIARTSSQGNSVKEQKSLDRVTSRKTRAILDIIRLSCQPVAQGRPLGHRAQPRRKKIAVALDRVTLIRISTILDRMMMS